MTAPAAMEVPCPKCERGGTGPHPAHCTAEMRFWRKVSFGACWEWRGSHNGGGYGEIREGGRKVYAHRFIYERVYGPIPGGRVVMHRCDNPRCVRPAHLDAGTQGENVRDMWEKGRGVTHRASGKTHCKHGHELTIDNTHRDEHGWRHCRTCHRLAERARKARMRNAA